ncbi:hypothetical protein U9M48_027632 [Paspalum notatum var. saurae]|uniref:Pectin acetylesterase n=1 Tax=Paspalum notatum var. saurae TaxID=547442 RepID=A0AAQ3TZU3_PASNO
MAGAAGPTDECHHPAWAGNQWGLPASRRLPVSRRRRPATARRPCPAAGSSLSRPHSALPPGQPFTRAPSHPPRPCPRTARSPDPPRPHLRTAGRTDLPRPCPRVSSGPASPSRLPAAGSSLGLAVAVASVAAFLESGAFLRTLAALQSEAGHKIRYCDGASFSGKIKDGLQNGTRFFFRGQRLWEALFHSGAPSSYAISPPNASSSNITGSSRPSSSMQSNPMVVYFKRKDGPLEEIGLSEVISRL